MIPREFPGRWQTGLPALTSLFLWFSVFFTGVAWAASGVELWERWAQSDPESSASITYDNWNRFLEKYIVESPGGITLVRYGAVTGEDQENLGSEIHRLSRVPISRFNRDQQRAFWINLYNALTVKLILDHAPVDSIRDIDISPGWFSDGPWGRKLVTVEDEKLSLDDIEHRILRPIWRDPRLHYALNCAARGCPNLAAMAYTAANSESLLDAGARAYVNHDRGTAFVDGALVVSSIYVWYMPDFGGSEGSVIAHLGRYAEPGLAAKLAEVRRIYDDVYDWRLNDAGGDGTMMPPVSQ